MSEQPMMLQIRSADAKNGILRHFPPLLSSLGVESPRAHAIASKFTDLLDAPEDRILEEIGHLLADEGLVEPWGHALATARAEHLARWIAPHLLGPRVIDVLCGDGAVGTRLEALTSAQVHLVERSDQRGVVERSWFPRIEDFDAFAAHAEPCMCDTAIVSTVLHHETNPQRTLALAARCASQRVVVVENCIEPQYGQDYQLLVDAMFNRSLYRTRLAWPGEHRTAEDWVTMCAQYGRAHIVDRCTTVPAIPLAHTLIVVDLEATR